jgi:hypothetical protein
MVSRLSGGVRVTSAILLLLGLAQSAIAEPTALTQTENLSTPTEFSVPAELSAAPTPESKAADLAAIASPVLHLSTASSDLMTVSNFSEQPPALQAQLLVPVTEEAPSLRPQPVSPDDVPFQPQIIRSQREARFAPGVTLFTPSGYGKSWGSGVVGVGFQSRTRFNTKSDGALGVSFGFGDARKAVGLDVGLTVLDLSEFDRGSLNLKLHRLLPQDVAIAVGVSNIILGGGSDAGVTPYGVVTKKINLKASTAQPLSQVFLSLGAGGGNFRSEANVLNQTGTAGVFGSIAVRVIEPVNLMAEWSGQDLSMGLSIIPFKRLPLVITPAVSDITGSAGDGVRFVLGIGYGFSY